LFNNQIIDKVSYQDNWHFELLNDTDGKSLERIDDTGASNQATNWHTAAETSNFATPGIVNSHNINVVISEKRASLQSAIISPDNDGIEDLLTLQFHTDSETYLATVSIYYPNGTLVKSWLKNSLLGQDAKISWDGINENNQKTPIGTYIVYIELLNQTTKSVEKVRIPFVVAGKM
jgi:flagellar hook assembly protein FlgD